MDGKNCFLSANQVSGSDPIQYTQYLYDGGGQRVMKITRVAGGNYKVRIYIGGIFEEYYEVNGGINMGYQDELHIMGAARKRVETRHDSMYLKF